MCVKHKITFINNDCIDLQLLNRSNLHLNKNGDRALGSAFCTYLKQNTANNRSSRNIDNRGIFTKLGAHANWTEYLKNLIKKDF